MTMTHTNSTNADMKRLLEAHPCQILRKEASIEVPAFLEGYVDVPTFLEACKNCHNYGNLWSCPPYDFNPEDFWKRYETLFLLASQIIFPEELLTRTYTLEERNAVMDLVLPLEKQKLSEELFKKEKQHPGSISLSAGCCETCKNGCTRPDGIPCRYPQDMRYSIESLGGNVGLTIEKLMGIHLEWMEEGRLPHHFVLVSGLLLP